VETVECGIVVDKCHDGLADDKKHRTRGFVTMRCELISVNDASGAWAILLRIRCSSKTKLVFAISKVAVSQRSGSRRDDRMRRIMRFSGTKFS